MKRFTITTIAAMLIAGISPIASGETPSVLLEKGIYAEQTKGDLDEAIGIYKQIVDSAEANQRYVAEAHYRLGMCQLKKGDKQAAAMSFRKVLADFSSQRSLANKSRKELAKLDPLSGQQRLPEAVMSYITGLHLQTAGQAWKDALFSNSHIYGVDPGFNLYSGGLLTVHNYTNKPMTEEMGIGNFSNTDMVVTDETGLPQKFRMVEQNVRRGGKYRLFWTPDRPVAPGETRLLGWLRGTTRQLSPVRGGGRRMRMDNTPGPPTRENFFLVIPTYMNVVSQTSEPLSRKRIGVFDVYLWQRDVPAKTKNQVTLVLKLGHGGPAASFGPVIEKTLISPDVMLKDNCIDLDTGTQFGFPKGVNQDPAKLYAWTEENKIDFVVGDLSRHNGVINKVNSMLIGMNTLLVEDRDWDKISAQDAMHGINQIAPAMAVHRMAHLQPIRLRKGRTFTYLFKTRDGGRGLLQIMGFNEAGTGVKIRYKLLKLGQSESLDVQQVAKIVADAVATISTCAETDPRVKPALASMDGLDDLAVAKELAKFLDSEKNTIRRSAIYILYMGSLVEITPAVPGLQKLCNHEEDFTRGMAAMALGAHKIDSSFQAICDMTLNDESPYARRCAAYALGLTGRLDAKPVLEKALKDKEAFVRNNAEAALTMLELSKDNGSASQPTTVKATMLLSMFAQAELQYAALFAAADKKDWSAAHGPAEQLRDIFRELCRSLEVDLSKESLKLKGRLDAKAAHRLQKQTALKQEIIAIFGSTDTEVYQLFAGVAESSDDVKDDIRDKEYNELPKHLAGLQKSWELFSRRLAQHKLSTKSPTEAEPNNPQAKKGLADAQAATK